MYKINPRTFPLAKTSKKISTLTMYNNTHESCDDEIDLYKQQLIIRSDWSLRMTNTDAERTRETLHARLNDYVH